MKKYINQDKEDFINVIYLKKIINKTSIILILLFCVVFKTSVNTK